VPRSDGTFGDLSRYPARRGYEDLVMLSADPKKKIAWCAVAFPKQRYAWFTLRDPRTLRGTVLWISNGGRHYAPWNGRHVNVMGIEETTSHFHDGVAASASANALTKAGIPTCLQLKNYQPVHVNHIMGMVDLPAGFDHVATIEPVRGGVELRSRNGKRATARIDLNWLEI
jgi:hypothetical protein